MNDSAVAISERECPVVTRESLSVFIRLTDWANPVAEINPAAANSVIRLVICFVSILIFQFKLVHIPQKREHAAGFGDGGSFELSSIYIFVMGFVVNNISRGVTDLAVAGLGEAVAICSDAVNSSHVA